MSDLPTNSAPIKRKPGRPAGSSKDKFPLKKRLLILKSLATNPKNEPRIVLASIDLYSKLANDIPKPVALSPSGAVLAFDFTAPSLPSPTPLTNAPVNSYTPLKPVNPCPDNPQIFSNNSVGIILSNEIKGNDDTAPLNNSNEVISPINAPINSSQSNNDLIIVNGVSNEGKKDDILKEICDEVNDIDLFKFSDEQKSDV